MKYLVMASQVLHIEILIDADSADDATLLFLNDDYDVENVHSFADEPIVSEVLEAP